MPLKIIVQKQFDVINALMINLLKPLTPIKYFYYSYSYTILVIGPPDPPTNCSVVNQTTDSLEVQCLPGFNGGLQQHFLLEVTDIQTKLLLANATDKIPEFTASVKYISAW